MDYRTYKDTNQKISLLGLGCMRFPKTGKDNLEIDEPKALEIIRYAYDHGVNYFDTAYPYHEGKSEAFVGRALKAYPRDSFHLATKLPIWLADTPADVERIFNEQLERLQVDYFDFYLIHALNTKYWEKCKEFKVYEFLQKKKEAGVIKKLGFSFHSSPALLETLLDGWQWDFVQIQLNYLDWEEQNAKALYGILEERGVPCIVMEPVRGGVLANPCEKANELFLAAAPARSVASWAVRYVASLPNVLVLLSGMTTLEQVRDNVATLSPLTPLTQEDRRVIDAALDAYRKKDTILCTGCRYCMDCPQGVDIPKVFRVYNEYAVNKDKTAFLSAYDGLSDSEKAHNCIACGLCETLCPQLIRIPEKMAFIQTTVKELQEKA